MVVKQHHFILELLDPLGARNKARWAGQFLIDLAGQDDIGAEGQGDLRRIRADDIGA